MTIEVIPLLNIPERHFLILFKDIPEPVDNMAEKFNGKSKNLVPSQRQIREQHRVKQIQKEITQAREDIRTITEDQ